MFSRKKNKENIRQEANPAPAEKEKEPKGCTG